MLCGAPFLRSARASSWTSCCNYVSRSFLFSSSRLAGELSTLSPSTVCLSTRSLSLSFVGSFGPSITRHLYRVSPWPRLPARHSTPSQSMVSLTRYAHAHPHTRIHTRRHAHACARASSGTVVVNLTGAYGRERKDLKGPGAIRTLGCLSPGPERRRFAVRWESRLWAAAKRERVGKIRLHPTGPCIIIIVAVSVVCSRFVLTRLV